MLEEGTRASLGHAAARDLRQWRVSDCADHRLASIEQPGLGSGRRRDDGFCRTVHRIAALGRGERHTVALEGSVHHRRGPSDRRRRRGGGDFQTNEEGRDGQNRAAAADELPLSTLSFMNESRRLDNARLKRELRLRLRYPTVREGLC